MGVEMYSAIDRLRSWSANGSGYPNEHFTMEGDVSALLDERAILIAEAKQAYELPDDLKKIVDEWKPKHKEPGGGSILGMFPIEFVRELLNRSLNMTQKEIDTVKRLKKWLGLKWLDSPVDYNFTEDIKILIEMVDVKSKTIGEEIAEARIAIENHHLRFYYDDKSYLDIGITGGHQDTLDAVRHCFAQAIDAALTDDIE
jgi:hypothetical protein